MQNFIASIFQELVFHLLLVKFFSVILPNCYCTFIVTREEEIEFSGWKGICLICVKINGDDLTAYEHE